ncbi:MAG: glycoside hydrolase family 99-like domain-containing protein, partial [Armatimonadota bacterium]
MMNYHRLLQISALMILSTLPGFTAGDASTVQIRNFGPDQGICRAERKTTITATLGNTSDAAPEVKAQIIVPKGVDILKGDATQTVRLPVSLANVSWDIEAQKPGEYNFGLNILSDGKVIASSSFNLRFFDPQKIEKLPYIPTPKAVKTSMLVGAHNCPLWEADRISMWDQVLKHPERTPALGFYAQENPEVSDWETKWAVEHGVSFFIYCWYRASQGEPVKMNFGSAIHEGLFKSRYGNQMQFTIMWENQQRGVAGVSDEKDLMTNLLPFWIDDYFKRSNYLKVDNKPVLFIYRPEFLIDDLGGIENVKSAFDKMRQACKDAGFDGLYILGEYRGLDANQLRLMKQLGLDYTFAYCWHVPDSPTPEVAVKTQMKYINDTQDMGIIPQVVTVSQAWSGWADEGSIWKIPPTQFEGLLRQAKDFAQKLPADQLGSKMLLLDNWNEWGEGHYIAPYREYGFGYLDAVRKVFSDVPEKHTDLIPKDVGMGPYDTAYKEFTKKQEHIRMLAGKGVRKPGSDEPGLVAWWTFDEAKDNPVALDYSGHRLGGGLFQASRVKGIDGNALDCKGGCVLIPSNPLLAPPDGMTIDCWVYTDTANQTDKWIVNRIYSGKTNSGYRFGFYQGMPCFSIPQTDWSHHLNANKVMPLGEWVHLAATYDGQMMRIYMNGEECGSMARTGPVNPNDFELCLGSFAEKHA